MSAFSIQSQIPKSSFKKVYPGRSWFMSKPNFKIQSSGMCECPFLAPSCRGRFRQAGRVTEEYRVRVASSPEETTTRAPANTG
jgi:hypothetical protein